MATIDIGKLTFTHKGDYDASTAYVLNDVVYYQGSAYIAKQNTTGNVPTNATYWNQFSAGSGGIWNSGLSLGSANQVVAVNSGASALEFQNVSSDWVKIAQTNVTSSTASVDFVNGTGGVVIDSTYRIYKLIGTYRGDTNGAEFQIRVMNSGSARSSSYLCEAFRSYYSGGTSRASATDKIVRSIGGTQAAAGQRSNFDATFFNMSDADHNTTAQSQFCCIDGSGEAENQVNNGISSGCYTTPEVHNGISFSLSSGNVAEAELTLVGLKG